MLVLDSSILLLKGKWVYFADHPIDMEKCDYVHFDHCHNDKEFEGFTRLNRDMTAVIDLTQNLDVIWQNMSELWKRSIKRAEEANLEISLNQYYKEYWRMNRNFELRTSRYQHFSIEHGIAYPSVPIMKKYGTLFTAKYNGEMLAGNIFLEDKNHIKLWRSASLRLEVDKEKTMLISRANRMLHWEAIKYAKTKGIKEYDLGGIWTEEQLASDPGKQSSLNFFKLGTGAIPVACCSYRKVYSRIYKVGRYVYRQFVPPTI